MSDIVELLREHWKNWGAPTDQGSMVNEQVMAFHCNEAADEIDRLRAESRSWEKAARDANWAAVKAMKECDRLRAIVDRLPDDLRRHWKFDQNQQPLSSWHDREDFIERLAAEAAAKETP